jgi:riboflavin synthase
VFTGIIRERGRVVAADADGSGVRLLIEAPRTAGGVSTGDSVSVHGCCLTATGTSDGLISLTAVPETLRRSTLGQLRSGSEVNLELALRAGEPLGGHYVQGHVDTVARVRSLEPEAADVRLWIDAPRHILRYCVEKGSIAVDGVSLTIAELDADGFAVALVPHTLAETTLGQLQAGDEVNLEVDILAKYVERLVSSAAE